MSKKYIYILICLLVFYPFYKGYTQTGIGTQNPQAALRIDAGKNNETTGAPTAANAVDDVMVTTSGQLGMGVISPATKVDLRSTDPKQGIIGIGTNTVQTAVQAGTGALRYNAADGFLHYSDGVNWIPVPIAAPIKALVLANKSSAQSIAQTDNTQYITGWAEVTDAQNNFDNTTGIFTAPRDGFYIVSFNIVLASGTIPNNTRIETIIESNTTTNNIGAFKSVNSYPAYEVGTQANSVAGNCSAIFNLKAGNTIKFRIWHNLGGSRSTSTANSGTDNSISIAEL